MYSTPTTWRIEDLRVGKIIHGTWERVDPATRQTTGELQKFRVTAIADHVATLEIYHGDEPAESPPIYSESVRPDEEAAR